MKKFAALVMGGVLLASVLAAPIAHAATKPAAKPQPSGILLLYSDSGRYKKAEIYPRGGTDLTTAKCGSHKFRLKNDYYQLDVKLKKDKPILLRCTASNFDIYFLRKREKGGDYSKGRSFQGNLALVQTSRYASAAVQKDNCTFVHKTGVTRTEAIVKQNNKSRCIGDDDPNENDVKEKLTPTMSFKYSPSELKRGSKTTLTAELKLPNDESLSPEECSGTFRREGPEPAYGRYTKDNAAQEYSFRYNPKTRTCMYKDVYRSYETKTAKIGEFRGTAKFSGNKFLNPGDETTYSYKVVK